MRFFARRYVNPSICVSRCHSRWRATRFVPRLEAIEPRIVPSTFTAQLTNGTDYAKVSNKDGDLIDSESYGTLAYAYGTTSETQAKAWDSPSYFGDGGLDISYYATAYSQSVYPDDPDLRSSGFAFANGQISVLSSPDAGTDEAAGEKMVVYAFHTFETMGQGNYTADFTVDGKQNFTGYFMSHIGDSTLVTFNVTASSNTIDGSQSSIDQGLTLRKWASASDYKVLNGYDMTAYEDEDLTLQDPNTTYVYWAGADKPIYRYDLNNDGAWDYEGTGPATFTWQQLQGLGLSVSSTPYTYRVQAEWPLQSLGINDSFSSEGTGTITVKPPRYRSPNFEVFSTFDLNSNKQIFGPYLPGVTLSVPFTMVLDRSGPAPTNMGCLINGQLLAGSKVVASDPYVWKVYVNVGQFGKDKTGLKDISFAAINLKANYSYDVLGYFNGLLDITSVKPNFELQVQAASGAGTPINNDDARLINGIKADMKFLGHFTNVPEYYDSKLSMTLGGASKTTLQGESNESATLTLQLNAGSLRGPKASAIARIGNQPLSYFGDPTETIAVINKPNWFTGGVATFDEGAAMYKFAGSTVALTSAKKTPLTTKYAWLNSVISGLQTWQSLTAILNLEAGINGTSPIQWDQSSLQVQARALGTPVWDQTYSGSDLTLGGGLDSWTFNPVGLSIALANPVDLGNQAYFGKIFTISRHYVIAGKTLNVTLKPPSTLTGDVQGNAGMRVIWNKNRAEFDGSGTFFSLAATITGAPAVTVTAAAPGGWLSAIDATGSANFILNLAGAVKYQGSVRMPTLVPNADYRAWLDADYSFFITGDTLGGPFRFDSKVDDPLNGILRNVALVKFA